MGVEHGSGKNVKRDFRFRVEKRRKVEDPPPRHVEGRRGWLSWRGTYQSRDLEGQER